jgi:hypothetical protein
VLLRGSLSAAPPQPLSLLTAALLVSPPWKPPRADRSCPEEVRRVAVRSSARETREERRAPPRGLAALADDGGPWREVCCFRRVLTSFFTVFRSAVLGCIGTALCRESGLCTAFCRIFRNLHTAVMMYFSLFHFDPAGRACHRARVK